jgi:hypothetical protein
MMRAEICRKRFFIERKMSFAVRSQLKSTVYSFMKKFRVEKSSRLKRSANLVSTVASIFAIETSLQLVKEVLTTFNSSGANFL